MVPSSPERLNVTPSEVIVSNIGFIGDTQAPYTLVEFGDYECPPCRANHPLVRTLLNQHPKEVRFQFRNYPLTRLHPHAMAAAIMAEEARQKGRFAQIHNALYDYKGEITDQVIREVGIANESSIALSSEARIIAETRIASDIAAANRMRIHSTPTFVLCCPDGRVLLLNRVEDINKQLSDSSR